MRRYGDPRITNRIIGDIEARWWSKVDRRGDDECWPWKDKPNTEGYGVFGDGQKVVKAYRWGYERFVGPIPDGLMPDHTCHDPAVCKLGRQCPHRMCVNYRHLEPVENRENVLRGQSTKISDEYVPDSWPATGVVSASLISQKRLACTAAPSSGGSGCSAPCQDGSPNPAGPLLPAGC